jgi:hypothetical protein
MQETSLALGVGEMISLGVMYKLNKGESQLKKLTETSLSEQNFLERADLEAWIANHPDVLGEDLLVLETEHPLPTKLRIDILALDSDGNVVVVELKRDSSGGGVEWQAVKYASYCATLTTQDLCGALASWAHIDPEEARQRIKDFTDEEIVGEDLEELNRDQRLILVAGQFHPDVLSASDWLRKHSIDVRCVQLECFMDTDGALLLSPQVILPIPTITDIMDLPEPKPRHISTPESKVFSLSVDDISADELAKRLTGTLNRESELTPRFVILLEILLSESRAFPREEIKSALLKRGVGKDIGQAGRFLSNLSQFLTKKKNSHLRRLITFDGGLHQGQIKDNYQIVPEYRDLVSTTLDAWRKSHSLQKQDSALAEAGASASTGS